MQMTFDQAIKPGFLQAFAFRRNSGYVMRSEKRPGYGGSAGGGRNNRRKPRRPKAGILYILLTFLILLVVWPVGIVMLWRRKVRMTAGTKLLISLLTLCVSVFLIVFALTIHVDNPKYTEFQDKANDWLNRAAADVAVAGDAAYKKGVETWDVMTDCADLAAKPVMNNLADGIDKAVELTGGLRDKLRGTPDATPSPEPADTAAPEVTPDVTDALPEIIEISLPENTPDPDSGKPLSNGTLTAAGEFKPDETPAPTDTPAPTPEPTPEPTPTDEPEDGEDIQWTTAEEAAATEEPTPTPTAEPTPTPTPEPTPTPVPDVPVKAPGDATVYYNKEGKLYHMRSSCKKMTSAKPHTLAEAVEAGKQKCNACGSPDAAVLEAKDVVWADEKKVFHTTDECAKFEGQWTLIALEDALKGEYTPCPECRADIYAIVNAEPTPTPTPEPTPVPEAEKVSPAATLKPAGDARVYHSSNGKFYHRRSVCQGMTGSKAYKLSEITSKYRRCKTCDAPDTALVGKKCLWMDEDGLCHTSDECAKFKGAYTLIERDEALEAGKAGCPDCGADEYLVPNTVLADD